MNKRLDDYLAMRCKIDEVFEHYAKQSELYRRANIAQRLVMEDRFYHFTMQLLQKIVGPFDVT